MDNKVLTYFIQAYRARGFAAAAKLIPISPQGLTKAIHALEAELGVGLFEPQNGMQIPTEYGERFYRFAQDAIKSHMELQADFDRIRRNARSTLRVAIATGILGFLGFDFLEGFQDKHPDIAIEIEDYPDIVCEERLRSGLIDIAITPGPFGKDMESRIIHQAAHLFWMRADDPLADKKQIDLADLSGYRIAAVGPEYKCNIELTRLCHEHGITPGIVATAGEMLWLERMAHDTKTVTLTVEHVHSLFAQDDDIVARPFPCLPWSVGIIWRKNTGLEASARAFIDYAMNRPAER